MNVLYIDNYFCLFCVYTDTNRDMCIHVHIYICIKIRMYLSLSLSICMSGGFL